MTKPPPMPEFDVALVTPPSGKMTAVWWEWFQRFLKWDEESSSGGGTVGPAGPPGPTGPAGPTGATGPAGADGAGLTNGDKGDIVVASGGASLMFDTSVVTAAAKTVLDDTTTGAMLTTLGAEPVITAGTTGQYWRGDKSWQTLPAGMADAPSDNGEYIRVDGIWRLKSQTLDLNGLSQIDVTVPANAKMVRIDGALYSSAGVNAAIGWRGSIDGSTYLAGASDYNYAGFAHNTGSNGYINLPNTAASVGYITFGSDLADVVPQMFRGLLHLKRVASTNFNAHFNVHYYQTSSAALYLDTQHRSALLFTNLGSVLTLVKVRFLTTAGTLVSPSYIQLEWVY